MNKLIDELKNAEGFEGFVYEDTLGFATIGYGTKLPLSKEEAELLLYKRVNDKYRELEIKLDFQVCEEAKEILLNMSYQLGVEGVLKFKKMLKALEQKDYKTANYEMLNSLWAKQTPNRAKKLALKMANIKN